VALVLVDTISCTALTPLLPYYLTHDYGFEDRVALTCGLPPVVGGHAH
jgi:hypothetical protein